MVKKITKIEIIKLYLFDYEKRYYLRELAMLLKKPHQSIKPYVEELVREKILTKEERKNITDYKLNFQEKKIYEYLTIAEKEKLLLRLEADPLLKLLFEKLSQYFTKTTFIIFGSFAQGTQAQDIDLLVLGKEIPTQTLKEFEETYQKKIHKIHGKELSLLPASFLQEIYQKHLILNNTETILRFFGEHYGKNRVV